MRTLEPTTGDFQILLYALQHCRSVAKENGTETMRSDLARIQGKRVIAWDEDDRTVLLLSEVIAGRTKTHPIFWLNLCSMVDRTPGWSIALLARGVQMPSPREALDELRAAVDKGVRV